MHNLGKAFDSINPISKMMSLLGTMDQRLFIKNKLAIQLSSTLQLRKLIESIGRNITGWYSFSIKKII